MNALILVFLLSALLIANNRINKSILYPPFLFTLIWLIVISLYTTMQFLSGNALSLIKTKTLLFLFFANFIFSFAGGFVSLAFPGPRKKIFFQPVLVKKIVSESLLLIISLAVILIFFRALSLASEVPEQNFLFALRYKLSVLNESYGFLDYFFVLGMFGSLYRLFTFHRFRDLAFGGKFWFLLSVFLSIVLLFLSTGRTFFLFYFLSYFMVIYFKGRFDKKVLLPFLTFISIIFILIGTILSKGGDPDAPLMQNLMSGLKSMGEYFVGPILAFNDFFNSSYELVYGKNTFRFFVSLLNRIGLSSIPPAELVKEYVYVPFATNVYTVFYQYVQDFGVIGCYLIIFLISGLHTWLFQSAHGENVHVKMLAAFSYYPLVMVFFQDQYFSLLSFWIQLYVYSFLIFKIFRK